MASTFIPRPGTEYGPCNGKCGHSDCAQSREMARIQCSWCGKQIGYGRHFYSENAFERELIHASCLDEKIEREAKSMR